MPLTIAAQPQSHQSPRDNQPRKIEEQLHLSTLL
jgi:hypothetical protein